MLGKGEAMLKIHRRIKVLLEFISTQQALPLILIFFITISQTVIFFSHYGKILAFLMEDSGKGDLLWPSFSRSLITLSEKDHSWPWWNYASTVYSGIWGFFRLFDDDIARGIGQTGNLSMKNSARYSYYGNIISCFAFSPVGYYTK